MVTELFFGATLTKSTKIIYGMALLAYLGAAVPIGWMLMVLLVSMGITLGNWHLFIFEGYAKLGVLILLSLAPVCGLIHLLSKWIFEKKTKRFAIVYGFSAAIITIFAVITGTLYLSFIFRTAKRGARYYGSLYAAIGCAGIVLLFLVTTVYIVSNRKKPERLYNPSNNACAEDREQYYPCTQQ